MTVTREHQIRNGGVIRPDSLVSLLELRRRLGVDVHDRDDHVDVGLSHGCLEPRLHEGVAHESDISHRRLLGEVEDPANDEKARSCLRLVHGVRLADKRMVRASQLDVGREVAATLLRLVVVVRRDKRLLHQLHRRCIANVVVAHRERGVVLDLGDDRKDVLAVDRCCITQTGAFYEVTRVEEKEFKVLLISDGVHVLYKAGEVSKVGIERFVVWVPVDPAVNVCDMHHEELFRGSSAGQEAEQR
mmetsp:Transcript_806/g.2925  ORF Transcript_806/g.2925 Transcript_806/m.2925 type:complete len:245 (+) Transcript_806:861-1595(+)